MGRRSARKTAPSQNTDETYVCGDVEVDCAARLVRIADRRQLLTFGEFEMLLGFVQNRGRVLTREQLHTFGGRREESTLRAVDTVITRLRRKLHGAKLFQIETVLHIGYRCDWASASGGNKKKARRGPVGDRRT